MDIQIDDAKQLSPGFVESNELAVIQTEMNATLTASMNAEYTSPLAFKNESYVHVFEPKQKSFKEWWSWAGVLEDPFIYTCLVGFLAVATFLTMLIFPELGPQLHGRAFLKGTDSSFAVIAAPIPSVMWLWLLVKWWKDDMKATDGGCIEHLEYMAKTRQVLTQFSDKIGGVSTEASYSVVERTITNLDKLASVSHQAVRIIESEETLRRTWKVAGRSEQQIDADITGAKNAVANIDRYSRGTYAMVKDMLDLQTIIDQPGGGLSGQELEALARHLIDDSSAMVTSFPHLVT